MSRTTIPQRTISVDGTHRLAHFLGIAVFPRGTVGVNVTATPGLTTTVVDAYVVTGTFSVVSAVVGSLRMEYLRLHMRDPLHSSSLEPSTVSAMADDKGGRRSK